MLSGSCPKMNIADKETIAYASKKTAPKLSRTLPAKASNSVPSTARPPSILKLVRFLVISDNNIGHFEVCRYTLFIISNNIPQSSRKIVK